MALDYVKKLREETATGGEVLRPSARMSPEEATRREEQARAMERENGRFGRFRDQQGNWATAWQAPGPRTPLIAPRFVEPAGKIRRLQSGELVIEGGGREQPAMINPQDWVVVYEGSPDEAIVASDEEFRRVMTHESRTGAADNSDVELANEAQGPSPSAAPANAPTVTPGPVNMVPTVSIDGFVAQVLIDNARLRTELATAQAQRDDAEHQAVVSRDSMAYWERHAADLAHRGRWLYGLVVKAMGHANDGTVPPPPDREIEDWLADAGRIYREDLDKLRADEPPPPPPDQPVDLPADTERDDRKMSAAELVNHAAKADEMSRTSKRVPLNPKKG